MHEYAPAGGSARGLSGCAEIPVIENMQPAALSFPRVTALVEVSRHVPTDPFATNLSAVAALMPAVLGALGAIDEAP
jgi:hypothetical protein